MFDNLNEALKLREGYGMTYVMGKVTSNKDDDSAKSGSGINKDRILVAAPGLYNPDEGEIPWVGSLKKSPFGQGKNWGVYGSPYPGSDVALELQDGNASYAMYHSIQRYPSPEEFSKPGLEWGFKDPRGNILHVDLETDEVYFKTRAGVVLTISPEGKVSCVSKDDATLQAPNLKLLANVQHEGTFTSNGINIGSDHVHTGVIQGGDNTGAPNP